MAPEYEEHLTREDGDPTRGAGEREAEFDDEDEDAPVEDPLRSGA